MLCTFVNVYRREIRLKIPKTCFCPVIKNFYRHDQTRLGYEYFPPKDFNKINCKNLSVHMLRHPAIYYEWQYSNFKIFAPKWWEYRDV